MDHIWGAYSAPHNPQMQSRIFRYAQDAPKCPKLTVTEACPQFLDYPPNKTNETHETLIMCSKNDLAIA